MGVELDEQVVELLTEKRTLETNEDALGTRDGLHTFGRFKRRGRGAYVHVDRVGMVLMPRTHRDVTEVEARLKVITAQLLELQEARIAERDGRIAELAKRLHAAEQKDNQQNDTVQNDTAQNDIAQNDTAQKIDDLKRIEGIGPKIAELLMNGGICTFRQLSTVEPSHIKALLVKGGNRFATAEPATWPLQAKLAAEARWAELDELQL